MADQIETEIEISKELFAKLTDIANLNHRSVEEEIKYWERLCIEEFEKEHGEILLNKEP